MQLVPWHIVFTVGGGGVIGGNGAALPGCAGVQAAPVEYEILPFIMRPDIVEPSAFLMFTEVEHPASQSTTNIQTTIGAAKYRTNARVGEICFTASTSLQVIDSDRSQCNTHSTCLPIPRARPNVSNSPCKDSRTHRAVGRTPRRSARRRERRGNRRASRTPFRSFCVPNCADTQALITLLHARLF